MWERKGETFIMVEFSIREVADAVGSHCDCGSVITSVCTDSRSIQPGCLFVAIRGERFDGHDFIAQAFDQGAAAVLSERPVDGAAGPVILVKDTRMAFLHLASFYRSRFDIPVVGLTGSVGKTTTKEMVAAVLEQKFETLKTEGNLNNQIGLPRMIFRMEKSTQAAVLEMGMDRLGQISSLSQTARPTVGIITNIGVSHIENLGSQQGILKAKLEILDGMAPDAPLLLNGDDPLLLEARAKIRNPVVLYGLRNPVCSLRAEDVVEESDATSFTAVSAKGKLALRIPAVGKHNVYNALAAAAVGGLLGLQPAQIRQGLACYTPSGMRQHVVACGGITVVEDCYNASPDSIRASLSALMLMPLKPGGRRIAVLGDIAELGDYAKQAHRRCGEYAAEAGVDLLFTVGSNARYCKEEASARGVESRHFDEKGSLLEHLYAILREGDLVLFKASRVMRLEEVFQALYQRWNQEGADDRIRRPVS